MGRAHGDGVDGVMGGRMNLVEGRRRDASR